MSRRGEPLDDDPLAIAMRPIDVRRTLNELRMLGEIGAVLQRSRREESRDPNVIDMQEVAPGVFARAPVPKPRPHAPGPLGKLQRLERVFAQVRREVRR